MRDDDLRKYPRTHHLEGSRLQPGDEDLDQVPLASLAGRHVVVEEKVDGANSAVSFGPGGELRLQSRGHYLTGGGRERHFDVLKTWAARHAPALHGVLGERFVMYGEWVYAKHTVFYDALPHYFLEFDVLDRERDVFLDTPRRRELLAGLPVVPVPVLHEGVLPDPAALPAMVGPSRYIRPGHLDRLRDLAEERGLDPARARRETDATELAEGLYVKIEEDGVVAERRKWIRAGFLQAVAAADGHWLDRPVIPNQLAEGVDLFA